MNFAFLVLTILLLAGCSHGVNRYTPVAVEKMERLSEVVILEEIQETAAKGQRVGSPAPMPSPVSLAIDGEVDVARPDVRFKSPTVVKNRKATIKSSSEIADQLVKASIVFAIPSTANITQDIRAQLLIDLVHDLDELSAQLTAPGVHVKKKIYVSKIVMAKLDAADFEITNITPTEQAISDFGSTEWLWNLRPKRAGSLQVNVSITAIIFVGDKSTSYHIKTYDQIVNIEVTAYQLVVSWLVKYWQWIISTMILPLIIWAWKIKNERNKKIA